MPLFSFYDSTPIEIYYALKASTEQELNDLKTSWEQVRTQIYFNYLFTPSRKRKVSYETFKKDYLPFNFDTEKERVVMNDEEFAYIDNYFKNIENKN